MKTKRYCLRNHDTWLFGRTPHHHCRVCNDQSEARNRVENTKRFRTPEYHQIVVQFKASLKSAHPTE